jgi:hypothetical protein
MEILLKTTSSSDGFLNSTDNWTRAGGARFNFKGREFERGKY